MEQKLSGKTEKPITNGNKLENKPIRDEKGRIVGGVLNPEGRPPQSLNFSTEWFRFVKWIAKNEKVKPEDIENERFKKRLDGIRKGIFPFIKDTDDRLYGQPTQKIDMGIRNDEVIEQEQLEKLLKRKKEKEVPISPIENSTLNPNTNEPNTTAS